MINKDLIIVVRSMTLGI